VISLIDIVLGSANIDTNGQKDAILAIKQKGLRLILNALRSTCPMVPR
jgi:hypothetical protein